MGILYQNLTGRPNQPRHLYSGSCPSPLASPTTSYHPRVTKFRGPEVLSNNPHLLPFCLHSTSPCRALLTIKQTYQNRLMKRAYQPRVFERAYQTRVMTGILISVHPPH